MYLADTDFSALRGRLTDMSEDFRGCSQFLLRTLLCNGLDRWGDGG